MLSFHLYNICVHVCMHTKARIQNCVNATKMCKIYKIIPRKTTDVTVNEGKYKHVSIRKDLDKIWIQQNSNLVKVQSYGQLILKIYINSFLANFEYLH